MTCSICDSIGPRASANTGRDEYFGPPVTLLTRHNIEQRDNDLWECPECGAFFHWNDDQAYTGSGNNDEETVTRLSAPDAATVRAILHHDGVATAGLADVASGLLQLTGKVGELITYCLLGRKRDLGRLLLPHLLDAIGRSADGSGLELVKSLANAGDAALVRTELARRGDVPALDPLRAHLRVTECSVCRDIRLSPTPTHLDRLTPSQAALRKLGASAKHDLWECPECASLFEWESTGGNREGTICRMYVGTQDAYHQCIPRRGTAPAEAIEILFRVGQHQEIVLGYGMQHDRELVRQCIPAMIGCLAKYESKRLRDVLFELSTARDDAARILAVIEATRAKLKHNNQWLDEVAARCRAALA